MALEIERRFLIKNDNWKERGLEDLVDNLERYVDRNPLKVVNCHGDQHRETVKKSLMEETVIDDPTGEGQTLLWGRVRQRM